MSQIQNSAIQTALAVYAFESLPAFAADLPPRDMWTTNFDAQVGTVGQSVVTRINTTVFASTMNNLGTSGWASTQPSSSNKTATLAMKDYDEQFDPTTFATIGEAQLLNTFADIMKYQVANGIAVDAFNLVTSSTFTNACYVASSSLFNLTGSLNQSNNSLSGSTGLQSVGNLLTQLEIPKNNRYVMLNPNAYQGLSSGIFQTYVYGSNVVMVGNGYSDNPANSSWPGIKAAGFEIFETPRLNANTAKLPYGGASASFGGGTVLAGFAGNKSGLIVAARSVDFPTTETTWAVNIIDPKSGFPLTVTLVFDVSVPCWRLAVIALYGVASGNTNAIVPIISTTT